MNKQDADEKSGFRLKSFGAGFGAAITLCTVIGFAYLHVDGRYHDVQNERIATLEKYEGLWQEGVKSQEQLSLLQPQLDVLKSKYAALIEANWEQLFLYEQIRNKALAERLALGEEANVASLARLQEECDTTRAERNDLETRLRSVPVAEGKAVGDGIKAFDTLLAVKRKLLDENYKLKKQLETSEKSLLTAKGKIVSYQKEATKLRALIGKTPRSTTTRTPLVKMSKEKLNTILASLDGVSTDISAARIVARQIENIRISLSGEDFVEILDEADISDEMILANLIVYLSRRLEYPLSSQSIKSILSGISNDNIRMQVVRQLAAGEKESQDFYKKKDAKSSQAKGVPIKKEK